MKFNPMVIAMCGMPGAGKTTIAEKLQLKYDIPVLNPAEYRKQESGYSAFEAPNVDELWYGEAEKILRSGSDVIMDATFHFYDPKRRKLYCFCDDLDVDLLIIHCDAPYNVLVSRLERQAQSGEKIFRSSIEDMVASYADGFEDPIKDIHSVPIIKVNTESGEINRYNNAGLGIPAKVLEDIFYSNM